MQVRQQNHTFGAIEIKGAMKTQELVSIMSTARKSSLSTEHGINLLKQPRMYINSKLGSRTEKSVLETLKTIVAGKNGIQIKTIPDRKAMKAVNRCEAFLSTKPSALERFEQKIAAFSQKLVEKAKKLTF